MNKTNMYIACIAPVGTHEYAPGGGAIATFHLGGGMGFIKSKNHGGSFQESSSTSSSDAGLAASGCPFSKLR